MRPRAAAQALERIADLLELRGENPFKSNACRSAARALLALKTEDLAAALRAGELARVKGIGPSTLAIIKELADTGDSALLDRLSEETPEGLIDMLRIPGLGTSRIHAIHTGLGVDTLQELEAAAHDGRLASLPRLGEKTAAQIARGIAQLRETSEFMLYPHARAEAERLLARVRAVPGVAMAEIAGSIRRRCPVIRDIDLVASCTRAPAEVAAEFARAGDVRDAIGVGGGAVTLRMADGARVDLYCVPVGGFAAALWRATGSDSHCAAVRARGEAMHASDEAGIYAAAGLSFIEPERREGREEVEHAAHGRLEPLITRDDIKGVLHCHSNYSDGANSIAEMVGAARDRGWSYLGISDHSQSAAYAGGLTRDAVLRQHEEIDRLQEEFRNFRILKGIEADILADGRIDYDEEILDRFDYVIASVHSRFGLGETAMTDRVLRAIEDPHVTILGHPTGRLLLTREPYAIDMPAVLKRAAELDVAVELNADPHRLDLDWTMCVAAKWLECQIEIGPDAHSVAGLENMEVGIGIARKGWLAPADVMNCKPWQDIMDQARSRRAAK